MSDTDDYLAEVDQRAEAATEGPWRAITSGPSGGDHWYVTDSGESIALIHASDGEDEDTRQPDAEFIAHARTDVPRLVAALRAVLDLADEFENPDDPAPFGTSTAALIRSTINEALGGQP